jgi:hypothetical protein
MADLGLDTIIELRLFISCRKLSERSNAANTNTVVEAYVSKDQERWNVLGKTETVWGSANPDFETKFDFEFYFEEQTFLKFRILSLRD